MSNRHFQRRYHHQPVEMEPMDDSSENSNHSWFHEGLNSMQLKRSEMNELIMDYLVHEGFKEAAERFRKEAGIEPAKIRLDDQQHNHLSNHSTANNIWSHSNTNNNNHDHNHNNNNNSSSSSSNGNKCEQIGSNNHARIKENDQLSGDHKPSTAASALAGESPKVEPPDMMDRRIEIRRSIEDGDILKAQSLINLYYPELLDTRRNLYFKLQQQHLIELIRQQKIDDVLLYVHHQLSVDELGDLTEIERTLALLAYEQPDKSPYAGLLQDSHRLQLASEINDIILQEMKGDVEPSKPRLVTLLKLLYWTQNELERKDIRFPKMTDLVSGAIKEPKS